LKALVLQRKQDNQILMPLNYATGDSLINGIDRSQFFGPSRFTETRASWCASGELPSCLRTSRIES